MLDHLSIQRGNVTPSPAFYDAVLGAIGGQRLVDLGEVIGVEILPEPRLLDRTPTTGNGFRESHRAIAAPTRAAVRTLFDAAVAAGAAVLDEARLWPEYHPNYFGAFVRDPDGNNVEAVRHTPK